LRINFDYTGKMGRKQKKKHHRDTSSKNSSTNDRRACRSYSFRKCFIYDTLRHKYEELEANYEKLTSNYEKSQNQNQKLNDIITNDLKGQLDDLKQQNKELRMENKQLSEKINALEIKIDQLKNKVDNLAMREIVRSLEHWIALDIVQSKTKVKEHLFSIRLLENSQYKSAVENILKPKERNLIEYLKDSGDSIAHAPAKLAI